jgi:O-antigen/teichoic acid export membrane protein
MALIFTSVAYIFTDLSLGSALIQRPQISETDRSTVFWTSLVAGGVMTLVGIGLAPAAGAFFHNSDVVPLFAVASFLAFISSLDTTQTALLTRDMRFRSLEIRQIVSTLVGAAAALAMALAGLGAWTIIGQALVTAVVSVALVWHLSGWRPRWTYSRASLRTFGSFGLKTLAAKLLGYLITYTDNLLIGRYLGARALGVYSVAYNVMFLPVSRIAEPVQVVFYSAFAKLQDEPQRLGRAWLRGTELITSITVPAFLGLAIIAPDFVPVVLGDRWHDAVPVLQLLSIAGLAYSFQTLNWSVIQAMGQPGTTLRFMIFAATITIAAFVAGLHWGIVGVAGFFAVARAISMAVFTWTTCRTIDMHVRDFIRNIRWVVVLSLAMAVAVLAVRAALVSADVSAAARVALLVLVGIGTYGGLVAWLTPRLVADIRAVLRPSASASLA